MEKCSHCGGEIAEGLPCKACGIEIQYKDFKGSEMLDIKMPSSAHKSRHRFERKSRSAKKAEDNTLVVPKAKRPALSKPAFFLLAAITIILSSVAWYYILKFLLKF